MSIHLYKCMKIDMHEYVLIIQQPIILSSQWKSYISYQF